ncbi:MAG TPA: hypothetical protein PK239_04645, partial [Chitinophagales bacterium]|nr:hypothetical protein [Chitinophagales bacterium]
MAMIIPPQITMTQNECTVTLTASGGNSYLWNNGSADEAIEVAAPNTYTVIATDANGCTAQAGYEVQPNDVAPTDFSGNYTVCAMETPLDQVNGNVETWGIATTNLRLAGVIIIPAGKTLSINNTTLYMVGQNTKFIVEKGGILRIEEGAVLQGDNCAPQHWYGIRVQADHTISHPTVALVPDIAITGSPHHGVVYVRNAIIKDALVAIEDYNPTPPPPGGLDLPR